MNSRHNPESEGPDPLGPAWERVRALQAASDAPSEIESSEHDPLNAMLDVAQRLNSELNIRKVLALGAERIIEIFDAERVFIVERATEGRFRFSFTTTFDGKSVDKPEEEVSHAILKEVCESGRPVLVADASQDPRFARMSSVQHLKLHSVMAAPMIAADELLGVVYADNRVYVDAFDEYKLGLLRVFANHLGIAARNALLVERLAETRTELAALERLKTLGELTAYVAHRIKNPLSALKLQVGMLRDRWEDEAFRREFVSVAGESVDRMRHAIDELSDYARPSRLTEETFRIEEVLDSALALLGGEILGKGVRAITAYPERSAPVRADREKLREVFVNLIKNAVESMEDEPVRELRVSVKADDPRTVEAIIEDTGPGLPEGGSERLFEPFHTTKRHGTGLGLAYCRKVVREHGGRIAAEPRKLGARFVVALPAAGH